MAPPEKDPDVPLVPDLGAASERRSGLWRLPLPWVLAWRYARGQRSRMLRATALAALLATGLGVMAMVIGMALMTGYTEDLRRKLIGPQGEVIAYPVAIEPLRSEPTAGAGPGARDVDERRPEVGRAAQTPGVARTGRVAYGEGTLISSSRPEGTSVVLRGVEPDDPLLVQYGATLGRGSGEIPGALLGKELARQLAVEEGEVLRLVVLDVSGQRPRFRYLSIRVAGTFAIGFAEFDARWVLLDYRVLRSARGAAGLELVEFKLEDPRATATIAAEIEKALGSTFVVERWERLHRQHLAALALMELGLFLVLGLIVVVSTFNVASTLVILVRERRRDIGVLGALGMAPGQLRTSFIFYGVMLGLCGTLAGVLAGGAIAWLITELELVRFDPEIAAVYFIESVPFRVEATDLAAIVGFALAVTLLACSLPATRAGRVRPSDALRDE